MPSLLEKKRDGYSFNRKEVEWIISQVSNLPREQVGAFLMACQLQGLNQEETSAFISFPLQKELASGSSFYRFF